MFQFFLECRVPITKLYPVTKNLGTPTDLCCLANTKYIQIYSYGCIYYAKLIACVFVKLMIYYSSQTVGNILSNHPHL